MKKTIAIAALAFTAGAAAAGSIVAFSYKEVLTPEDFLARADVLLAEVADIGLHVAGTRDGRVFLRNGPPIACVPTPRPNVKNTVPIAQLKAGIAALIAVNEGRLDGETQLATLVDKCHIVGD